MQDVDNHMDDLFRKAAGQYPLKTGKGNWDDIVLDLQGSIVPAAVPAKKNRWKRYGGLLLLLLLLLVAGGIYINRGPGGEKTNHITAQKDNATLSTDQNLTRSGEQKAITENQKSVPAIINKEEEKSNDAPISIVADHHTVKPSSGLPVNNSHPANQKQWNKSQAQNRRVKTRETLPPFITSGNIIQQFPGSEQSLSATASEREPESSAVKRLSLDFSSRSIATVIIPDGIPATAEPETARPVNAAAGRSRQRGLYLGVLAGTSLNQVKQQGWRKPGLDAGIIGGYRFSNKLALETGVIYSRKYYYSDGKYFNPEKIASNMPPDMKIMSLEGSSSLFEIPLHLQYTGWSHRKSSLFAAAGFSSYLMTKEENFYHTMINGTASEMTGNYDDKSKYVAVTADFSLGYEYHIGKSRFRLAPYLNIPLKGIGVGSMPVLSTGIRIGFLSFTH